MAESFGRDDNRCYSRRVGVVLVDPEANRVLSLGLNGPPRGLPPCDSSHYLGEAFWPTLTDAQRSAALAAVGLPDTATKFDFVRLAAGKKICPRRYVDAGVGECPSLCTCLHGERNAIINSGQSLRGAWAMCWCPLPCNDCAGSLINAEIRKVFCLSGGPDYGPTARWQFAKAGVEVVERSAEYYLDASPPA